MAFIERYTNVTKGALTFTGNTLGFSSYDFAGGTGIGAFLSTTAGLAVAGYPAPATLNWQQNGSTAVLNMPADSTVLYAELIWGGSSNNDAGTLPISTLNTPITFKTPLTTQQITYDPATALETTPVPQVFYTRSQNVTALVAAAGAGTYEVDGVPATLNPEAQDVTCAGWVLAVAYTNNTLPYAQLNIYVGNPVIQWFTPPVDVPITGFVTPLTGSFGVRVLVGAGQGNTGNYGDSILIGPTNTMLTPLSGPNNPVNNFFGGQINNDQGLLDTTGSFGNYNNPPGGFLPAVRSDWDITNVDGTAGFTNGETNGVLELTTTFDTYYIPVLGFQIGVQSPNISFTKTATPSVTAGDMINYSLTITNNGAITTDNFLVTDPMPTGVTLNVPGIQVVGESGPLVNTSTTSQLTIDVGAVAPGQTVTIYYSGTTTTATPTPSLNTANSSFNFTPLPGNTFAVTQLSNPTSTQIISADVVITKTSSPNPIVPGTMATYTLTVTNNGPSPASNVVVQDTVGLTSPQVSLDGGVTWNTYIGSVLLGTVAVGAAGTQVILVRGMVPTGVTTPVKNTAQAISTTPDPNSANNTVFIQTPVSPSADISVTKVAKTNPIVPGQMVEYIMTVNNVGPSDASAIALTDAVVAGISNPEYLIGQGSNWQPWVGNVNVGPLVAGGTITVMIRGTATSSMTGAVDNTASVQSQTQDPNVANNTSTITTPAQPSADLSITNTLNTTPVVPGQPIAYTLTAANLGPSDAQNVVVTDGVPSTVVNPMYSVDGGTTWLPWTGSLTLGTMPSGATQNILIKGTVSPSATGSVSTTGAISSTTPDPNLSNNQSTSTAPFMPIADMAVTNTLNTVPLVAGQPVNYTIHVANQGPSDAQNVTLTDAIPPVVNNPQYSVDGGTTWLPWTGSLALGTMLANTNKDILIRGTLDSQATGTLATTSEVSTTTQDPNLSNNIATTSASITTLADLSLTKVGTPNPVTVGGQVAYTVTMSNAGPSDAVDVVLTDVIPASIDNPQYSTDGGTTWQPWTGVLAVGTLKAKSSQIVKIRGAVNDKAGATVVNTGKLTSQTPDANPQNSVATATNLVNNVQVIKTANVAGVSVGDTITYTLEVMNKGGVTAEQVVVTDVLPEEVSYVGNLTVNGAAVSGNIQTGLLVGNIVAGATTTITFDVEVVAIPADKQIGNTAVANYVYRANPTAAPISGKATSPVNEVKVYAPSMAVTKTSSPTNVAVGEPLVYTMKVTNTGDIALDNVVVTDELPTSFQVQQIQVGGVTVTGDIRTGINIGTLAIGQTVVVTITVIIQADVNISTFKNVVNVVAEATVDTTRPEEPVQATATDQTGVNIYNPKLVLVKSVDKQYAVIGDVVTYTIKVTNQGSTVLSNVNLDNVVISDILSSDLSFVSNSVMLNGKVMLNVSILNGINIGTLAVGQTVTLQFQAQVMSDKVTPIENTVQGQYAYTLPNRPPQSGKTQSNRVSLNVVNVSLVVEKTATPETVAIGDTVTYTVKVTNTGDVTARNILFTDALPKEVTLVPGSFSINGKVVNSVDMTKGIIIPDIAAKSSVTITYQATITTNNCRGILTNQASVTYTYQLPDGSTGTKTQEGALAMSEINVEISQFKQMSIEKYLMIPEAKPNIEVINNMTGTIDINHYNIITTPITTNIEGQQLTGNKAIIRGTFNLVIEYTALDAEQGVHSAHYSIPFSTFIILPPGSHVGKGVDIVGEVEDIYYTALDIRTFFVNITALINMKMLSC
ncbi:MAG: DUF3794 domain-containing protein [Niameybacter sp.]